ncbi:uncharacterized protein HLK63_F05445 [Nakaseomyces glabratus]|nr:hypothetical protein J6895_01492 [Nakaseomyces glabratus]UCS20195.1 uncharacterized protein GW608_F05445 [Nakaseomyces glabratus]UCS25426.1 uncharacterized protein HLK63_F05445 [Nakaseomyces glabratus]UCS30656.1 uncharacterized protein HLK64_F05445 [Nakaseomyces glabratus]UCS35885.1 uncharacterized protein HLK62_F05445 [Nakaseomyces glabratus]
MDSYKTQWLTSEGDERVRCELLAFGTVEDLERGTLNAQDRDVLVKLSILNYVYGKQVVTFDTLLQNYAQAGIELTDNDIEMILLELCNHGIMDVSIDSVAREVKVLQLSRYRDVYCGERELLVVNPAKVITNIEIIDTLQAYSDKL